MNIKAIVAIGNNNEIGKDNKLIWHMPADLRHFKQTTSGKMVIMGRKSWESIGRKPLPNRPTIVVTKNHNYKAINAKVLFSIKDVIGYLKDKKITEVFILGGAQIYRAFAPYVNELFLTEVKGDFDADTFFPLECYSHLKLHSQQSCPKDSLNKFDYNFCHFKSEKC